MHVGQCNAGASYQMAVGRHEGCVLVEFPRRGHPVGWPANVCNKTDGSRPHMCMPFVGKRVSLIAYFVGARVTCATLGCAQPRLPTAIGCRRDVSACSLPSRAKSDVCLLSAHEALKDLCEAIEVTAREYSADDVIQASPSCNNAFASYQDELGAGAYGPCADGHCAVVVCVLRYGSQPPMILSTPSGSRLAVMTAASTWDLAATLWMMCFQRRHWRRRPFFAHGPAMVPPTFALLAGFHVQLWSSASARQPFTGISL